MGLGLGADDYITEALSSPGTAAADYGNFEKDLFSPFPGGNAEGGGYAQAGQENGGFQCGDCFRRAGKHGADRQGACYFKKLWENRRIS